MQNTGLVQISALPSTPGPARRELRSLLRSAEWPGDVEGVVLAVHEALINSMTHAGGATGAAVAVEGSAVLVEVRDRGPGFDPARHVYRPPEPFAERGRGLWLMANLAESCDVSREDGETRVRLLFTA